MLASHHHLSIENDVNTKDKRAQAGIDNVDDFVAREEKDQESKKQQADQTDKEYSVAGCEIDLGLHGENGEGKDQDDGDANGHHDLIFFINGNDESHQQS